MSLADLIVLGGCAAVEQAAKNAGHDVQVPFSPGRTDASQEQTDVDTFAVLEPTADGFRNYFRTGDKRRPEELLIDRSSLLALTAPEMTVLVGGLRVLSANAGHAAARRLHPPPRTLTNDFFVNLLDMGTEWTRLVHRAHLRGARPRDRTGQVDRYRCRPHLRFELPAPSHRRGLRLRRRSAEVRAGLRGGVGKVMNLDRFDLPELGAPASPLAQPARASAGSDLSHRRRAWGFGRLPRSPRRRRRSGSRKVPRPCAGPSTSTTP